MKDMKIWTMMKDGFMVLGGRCNFHPCYIGDDLKSIKKDVAACEDVEVMKKQCKDAQKQAKTAHLLNTDDFWGRLRWGVEPDEVIKVVQDDDFS